MRAVLISSVVLVLLFVVVATVIQATPMLKSQYYFGDTTCANTPANTSSIIETVADGSCVQIHDTVSGTYYYQKATCINSTHFAIKGWLDSESSCPGTPSVYDLERDFTTCYTATTAGLKYLSCSAGSVATFVILIVVAVLSTIA